MDAGSLFVALCYGGKHIGAAYFKTKATDAYNEEKGAFAAVVNR